MRDQNEQLDSWILKLKTFCHTLIRKEMFLAFGWCKRKDQGKSRGATYASAQGAAFCVARQRVCQPNVKNEKGFLGPSHEACSVSRVQKKEE